MPAWSNPSASSCWSRSCGRCYVVATPTVPGPGAPLRLGAFTLDPRKKQFDCAGRAIELTPREFDVLLPFADPSRRDDLGAVAVGVGDLGERGVDDRDVVHR